jgi:hypothetical protein
MKIKNKKGFLLGEETLKIVIAVICILFLVYLLASLYYNSVRDKNADLAKSSIEYIADEINSGAVEIEIYNPQGWFLLNHPNNNEILCICRNLKSCDPDETCAETKETIKVGGTGIITIDKSPLIIELNDKVLTRKN